MLLLLAPGLSSSFTVLCARLISNGFLRTLILRLGERRGDGEYFFRSYFKWALEMGETFMLFRYSGGVVVKTTCYYALLLAEFKSRFIKIEAAIISYSSLVVGDPY